MSVLAQQLELNLWDVLDVAAHEPETLNFRQLCQTLDLVLEQLPDHLQLAIAGDAISEIVEIYQRRADILLDALEWKDNGQGLILSEDFLSGLLRGSMTVDLSDIMEDLFSEIPKPLVHRNSVRSVAGGVRRGSCSSWWMILIWVKMNWLSRCRISRMMSRLGNEWG